MRTPLFCWSIDLDGDMKGATGTETPYSKRRRPYSRPSKHCSFAILNNAVHVIQGNQIIINCLLEYLCLLVTNFTRLLVTDL